MHRNFELIEKNNIKINTLVEGDGKPVIFVHGWPESCIAGENK